MKFTFNSKVESICSAETIEKEGDYQGPDSIQFDFDGEIVELNSSNVDDIILMDIISGSSWFTPNDNKVMVEEISEGIFKRIYNLDIPGDSYPMNKIDIIEGKATLVLIEPTISIEECRQELSELMFLYDAQNAATVIPSLKEQCVTAITQIDWILNSLPSDIDIRDVIAPSIELI